MSHAYVKRIQLITNAGCGSVPFELRMFSRAAALLSTAHVRVNDELTNTRRTLAVRDVGQDVMEVLDLLDSRLVLHHTPV